MKLRNKKTGEIKDACEVLDMKQKDGVLYKYYSLTKLNEEWEDYEEPKKFWYIDCYGDVQVLRMEPKYLMNCRQSIGDYFKTKEQAEKAVEKLKAWKRLEDKGFMFCGKDCINKNNVIYFEFGERPLTQLEADEAERELDLLFGGEK